MERSEVQQVVLPPARTGRPSSGSRAFDRDDLVRVESRVPAWLAGRVYEASHLSGRPVGATVADLLAEALAARDEVAID